MTESSILDKYKLLLRKHSFELSIFPERNIFNIGDNVLIEDYSTKNGKICSFVQDGSLFIKTHEYDLGRNYHIDYISTKTSPKITIFELLENHRIELQDLQDKNKTS
jgi:hypothetical protein